MRDLSHNEILAVTGGTLSLSLFKCAPKPSKLSCLSGLLSLFKCAPKPVCAPAPTPTPTPTPTPEPEPEIG